MEPQNPTPDPSNHLGWIAPTEAGRAAQLLLAHPHLVAEKLELRWFPNAQLLTHATTHQSAIDSKSTLATGRPIHTRAIEKAVAGMRQPLSELRGVIKKKFKDDYEAYYPTFGLVKSGPNWILPVDHDVLVKNLQTKLLPALTKYGFADDPDTGTAIWQPLLNALDTANTDASKTDASRAEAVGTSAPQDEQTTKALRALVHLVQAQFPDTWEAVLREWEWQKTSF
ncbi:hypothetical protein Q5H93_03740 [Hymenobacter sp. ASUV-10]|uniref:Uncharacterized protein n=1 Tax=Hymenobacter aranciens TaxID=3063996 RepID=A0ABT9B6E2_9BACT|nr:hypothetical protein [Hymenobacter sp. ASUV-10]MDO7873832.1 hypothetical protein [Hymenobacter sp. ASUV-10]